VVKKSKNISKNCLVQKLAVVHFMLSVSHRSLLKSFICKVLNVHFVISDHCIKNLLLMSLHNYVVSNVPVKMLKSRQLVSLTDHQVSKVSK